MMLLDDAYINFVRVSILWYLSKERSYEIDLICFPEDDDEEDASNHEETASASLRAQ